MKLKRKKLIKIIAIVEFIIIIILGCFSFCLYFYYDKTKVFIMSCINKVHIFIQNSIGFLIECFKSIKNQYPNIEEIFNNRELAIISLFCVFIVLVLCSENVRKSFYNFLKNLFNKRFIRMWLYMFLYCSFIVYILYKVKIWDVSLLKSTIVWFFTVAIISTFRALDKAKNIDYFINVIKDNLKIVIILEFITNLYAMSFLVEVILLIVVFFASIMIVLIDTKPEFKDPSYKRIKNFLQIIITVIIFTYIINSINLIVKNFDQINLIALGKEIIITPILSISIVVFNYIFVVYAMYEVLFIRLNFKETISNDIRKYLYFRILLLCNINISKIDKFINKSQIMNNYVSNKSEVKKIILNFKDSYKMPEESIT